MKATHKPQLSEIERRDLEHKQRMVETLHRKIREIGAASLSIEAEIARLIQDPSYARKRLPGYKLFGLQSMFFQAERGVEPNRKELHDELEHLYGIILQTTDILFTTCANAGDPFIVNAIGKLDFIVIDEMQCGTEPHVLIPILSYVKSAALIILLGDENQAEPVVMSYRQKYENLEDPNAPAYLANSFAQQLALSLFDRLKQAGFKWYLLTAQHRVAARMAEMTSEVFYNGVLKDDPASTRWEDRPNV
ncbi:ATP-dependent helicase NAM7 [Agyrium rufum]|nr:ATP-dependent helicase NAM7 [Agyrium rufum]